MNPSIIYPHFTDKEATAQKIKLSKIALTPKETNVDSQKRAPIQNWVLMVLEKKKCSSMSK